MYSFPLLCLKLLGWVGTGSNQDYSYLLVVSEAQRNCFVGFFFLQQDFSLFSEQSCAFVACSAVIIKQLCNVILSSQHVSPWKSIWCLGLRLEQGVTCLLSFYRGTLLKRRKNSSGPASKALFAFEYVALH